MRRYLIVAGCLVILLLGGCVAATPQSEGHRQQADVHYKLAVAHLQGDNPGAALRELLKAVELDPKNSEIHVTLAQAYQQRRAYAEAEKHYLKALELSENDPSYQNNIATLYLDMQQWDRAIHYFDLAARNLLFESTHIALTGKGYAYLQKEEYNQALNVFRAVAAEYPNYAPAFYYQAEVYRVTGAERLEQVALQRTVDLAPDVVQARHRLAVLHIKAKNFSAARTQLETIINFSPESDAGRDAAELLKTLP